MIRARPIAPLARLRRVARLGADAPAVDLDWLGGCLGRWLEDRPRGATLEAVLGILPMADGVDPVERRAELVRALAARRYPGLPRYKQAQRIAADARTGAVEPELIALLELAGQSRLARWPLAWRRIDELLQSAPLETAKVAVA